MDTIINGKMVAWARQRAGLSVFELAKKLSVSAHTIEQWETGEKNISMGQAKQLSKSALVPFGLLFGDIPPDDHLPIPDFRSLNDNYISQPSPELLEVIYDAQEKQDWYKEYLLSEGCDPLEFIGSETINNSPVKVAQKIYDVLELEYDDYWGERKNWEKSLQLLIEKTEDAGIIVIRNSVAGNNNRKTLNVEEFRGFILNDDIAPLIFINGKDAKSAQMFTLIHEITHLLLGESALIDAAMLTDKNSLKIEKFCNQVAAEFLTPEKTFIQLWKNTLDYDENINIMSNFFKVSKLVVISRAFQLKLIDWSTLKILKEQEMARLEEIKKKKKKDSKGGNFFETLKFKVSPLIAQAVISEVNSGRLLYRDAYRLLGVKNLAGLNKLSNVIGEFA